MPRGNGTGPEGKGSMTGRRMGLCAGNGQPGYASGGRRGMGGSGFGNGRGNGGGMGRGFRNRFFADRFGCNGFFDAGHVDVTPEQETAFLSKEEELLKHRLEMIGERRKELDRARENKGE